MEILKAEKSDLPAILALQRLAYQSEAALLNDYAIPPLTQTIEEAGREFDAGIFLKLTDDGGQIIGSVRGYTKDGTLYIGKLMVHPVHQNQGLGSKLLLAMEDACPQPRFELFTSDKSIKNIKLYEKMGYKIFRQEKVSKDLKFVYLEKNG